MTRIERLTALLARERRREEEANAQAVRARVAIRVAYEKRREEEVAACVTKARALQHPTDKLSLALKQQDEAERMIARDSGDPDYWHVRCNDGGSLGTDQGYHLRNVREHIARLTGWMPAPQPN